MGNCQVVTAVGVGRVGAGGIVIGTLRLQPNGALGSGIRFALRIASAFLSKLVPLGENQRPLANAAALSGPTTSLAQQRRAVWVL